MTGIILAPGHDGRLQGCLLLASSAFSETDFTEDLKKFDVPILIMHGDDDQIVPIGASALLSSKIAQGWHVESLSGPAARHVLDP